MGEILDDARTAHQLKEEASLNYRNKQQKAFEESQAQINAIYDKKEKSAKNFNEHYEYKQNVKRLLLQKPLMTIMSEALDMNNNTRSRAILESLIGNYIRPMTTGKGGRPTPDYGHVDSILNRMKKSDNFMLREIAEDVGEYASKIVAASDPQNPASFLVDEDEVKKFWDDIDSSIGEDLADATNTIRLRVANAEEEFLARNQQDKENIKSIISDTSDRIKSTEESRDNDVAEKIAAEESAIAKEKIYQIQHEAKRSVFDRIVRKLSEKAVKDSSNNSDFVLESGRIDMQNIVESARCMYTMLETLSCLKLDKVNREYINDAINSI